MKSSYLSFGVYLIDFFIDYFFKIKIGRKVNFRKKLFFMYSIFLKYELFYFKKFFKCIVYF